MARGLFGSTLADFVFSAAHGPTLLGATVWDSQTGGNRVTDLLDMDGDSMTNIGVEATKSGLVQFKGPDGGTSILWVDTGTGPRVKMVADPAQVSPIVVDASGGTYPPRPASAVLVIWRGTTTPAAAVAGDIYVNTGA